MKSGLFWRMFSAILAVVLVTVVLFTAILLTYQRTQAQDNYETEVRVQARQVAEYMQHANQLSMIVSNATIQFLVNEKIADIYDQYNADIWIEHKYMLELPRNISALEGMPLKLTNLQSEDMTLIEAVPYED